MNIRQRYAFFLLIIALPLASFRKSSLVDDRKIFSSSDLPGENARLATLCKVWGFLKYYHPEVANGSHDWDRELLDHIDAVKNASTNIELSKIYLDWINSLGAVKKKKDAKPVPDSLKFNLDTTWLFNKSFFTTELTEKLQFILHNRNKGKNYYVSQVPSVGNTVYDHEKDYPDSLYPHEGCRLLALFRYWNIVNYFYPYKYKMDENWETALDDLIPYFRNAKDTGEYNSAMLRMVSKLNDSHACWVSNKKIPYISPSILLTPFTVKIMDTVAVVNWILSDSLTAIDDIRYGDAILKADGKSVIRMIDEKTAFCGASNHPTLLRNVAGDFFYGASDSVALTLDRDGEIITRISHRYPFSVFSKPSKYTFEKAWKTLDGNVGYINMGTLKRENVDEAMKDLMNTKAIVFDMRNYPQWTIYKVSDYLNSERKDFVTFTKPDISYPGVFEWSSAPLKTGINNKDHYKGKVVLLVNELTQSQAEFTCMAFQTAPDVTIIGSQTAGADGNVSLITLPGGYTTYMTGIGVYYPDGTETQRVGIVPDIVVEPTIEGIRAKKDEVLDRAIEYIKNSR